MFKVPGVLPRRSNLNPLYSCRNLNIVRDNFLLQLRVQIKKALPDSAARTQQDRNSTRPPHDHSSPALCCFRGLASAFGCTSFSVCSWVLSQTALQWIWRCSESAHNKYVICVKWKVGAKMIIIPGLDNRGNFQLNLIALSYIVVSCDRKLSYRFCIACVCAYA